MKNKKKLLSILIGFIFIFMVGCGVAKNNTTKKIANKNTKSSISESKNKSNSKKSSKTKEDKKSDKNLEDKDSKENNSTKEKDNSKTKNDDNSNTNTNTNTSNNGTSNSQTNKAKENVQNNTVSTPKNDVEKETFTIILSQEEKGYTGKSSKRITTKQIQVEKDKNAMIYLKENFNAKDTGGLIIEISGIHNEYPIRNKTEEQKKLGVLGRDWFIYLNDKKTPVGANDIYPKKGDILHLDIHEWDKRELKF